MDLQQKYDNALPTHYTLGFTTKVDNAVLHYTHGFAKEIIMTMLSLHYTHGYEIKVCQCSSYIIHMDLQQKVCQCSSYIIHMDLQQKVCQCSSYIIHMDLQQKSNKALPTYGFATKDMIMLSLHYTHGFCKQTKPTNYKILKLVYTCGTYHLPTILAAAYRHMTTRLKDNVLCKYIHYTTFCPLVDIDE